MSSTTCKVAAGIRLAPVLVHSSQPQPPGRFTTGVVFNDMEPGAAPGDQIIAVNGKALKTEAELFDALKTFMRGQSFELNVQRGDAKEPAPGKEETITAEINKAANERLGLGVVSDRSGKVIVNSVAFVAAKSPLAVGDRIVSVNGKAMKTLAEVRAAIVGQTKLQIVAARHAEQPPSVVMAPPKPAAAKPAKIAAAAPSPAVSPARGKPEEVDFAITYDEGEEVGVRVHDLKVDNVIYGSVAEQHFKLGDKIARVNNREITSDQDFYSRLQRGAPGVTIRVLRMAGAAPGEEPQQGDRPEMVTLKLCLKDGEVIGITPNESLKVLKVQPKTLGADYFHPGDIVTTINGTKVNDLAHLHKLIESHRPNLEIQVDRSKFREEEMEMRQLPQNIESMITRHAGFEYLLVDVKYDEKSGRAFGLGLANCAHNRVIVTSVKDKSVAADHFKVYDRILTINGMPVTDENVTKEYICACGGTFQSCIERPKAVDKWHEVKMMYAGWRARAKGPAKPEDQLPGDALLIAQQQRDRMKAKAATPGKALLKKTPTNPTKSMKGLTFSQSSHTEVNIASDVPPNKQLRRCS